MNNLLKWGLGLAALGVTVYVAGRAWKKSQANSKATGSAGFAGAAGGGFFRPITPQCLCGGLRRDCPCPKSA